VTVEPSGPTALTVVNGINDYDAVRICFLPGQTPWPAAPAGLPFAVGQVVDIAAALPAGSDVTPWVIAGNLAATAGLSCQEILALAQPDGGVADGGPAPPVVAAPLGVVPQGVLAAQRSLLLVPTGCMGGAGHDADAGATAGCGMGYTSQTPTTGVVLLAMSRIADTQHVSLQAVSASAALPPVNVHLQPGFTGAQVLTVAGSLAPGAIGPEPPFHMLAPADFGSLSKVQIGTFPLNGSSASSTTQLADVLATSAVGTDGFANGATLVLVAVGGAPGAAAGPFWHALTYALVKGNPG
jgi:hypothetical protein